MALSKEKFQELRNKGLSVDQIVRFERGEKPAAPVQSAPVPPKPGLFSTNTLKGETTYKADQATTNPLGNVARTVGNVPSSAAKLLRGAVAPVNPLDTQSPLNIGANIVKGAEAAKGLVKESGGFGGAMRNLASGVYDTVNKGVSAASAFVRKEATQAVENPAQFASDIAAKGVEDPLLVPSLLYGGPKAMGAKKDLVSTAAKPVTAPVNAVKQKVATVASERAATRSTSAVDDLEAKYQEIARGWVSTRKASDKASKATEAKNKAGTTGRTPERTLAEHGIVPQHEGTKFSTLSQADQLRSQVTPLYEANRAALQEVAYSTPAISLAEVERRAVAAARSERNIAAGTADDMERNIRAAFAAYRKNYGDNVPITVLDDIKSARWGDTKFDATRPLKGDENYAIGNAAKDIIEDTARKVGADDVAQLNREIGDMIGAAKFLEGLDGKAVLYGRMGTHMMRLAGTIAGTGMGGGALGGVAGYVGGDMVARMLRSTSIASPVKRIILKNLERKDPAAYQKTLEWLEQQGLDRELRQALPAPSFTPMGPRNYPQSTPLMVGGKKPPTSYEQASKRATGQPEYGGLYEYNQSIEASRKAALPQSQTPSQVKTPQTAKPVNSSSMETTKPQSTGFGNSVINAAKGFAQRVKDTPNKDRGMVRNPLGGKPTGGNGLGSSKQYTKLSQLTAKDYSRIARKADMDDRKLMKRYSDHIFNRQTIDDNFRRKVQQTASAMGLGELNNRDLAEAFNAILDAK